MIYLRNRTGANVSVGEIFFSIPLVLTTVVFALALFDSQDSEVDEEKARQSRWHY